MASSQYRKTGATIRLDVVFHIPGRLLRPDYTGLRTGTLSKRKQVLQIQIAVPDDVLVSPSPETYVVNSVQAAINLAASHLAKKRIVFDKQLATGLLGHVCGQLNLAAPDAAHQS